MTRISVIGAGAWGTALACVGRRAGHDVALWAREQATVDAIRADRANPTYLPDIPLEPGIAATTDIAEALGYCRQLVTRPADTVLVLISDLFEGGNADLMRARVARLVRSGVTVLCLLALSDEGAPVHDRQMASDLVELGATVMSCTPDEFPDVLAAALDRS